MFRQIVIALLIGAAAGLSFAAKISASSAAVKNNSNLEKGKEMKTLIIYNSSSGKTLKAAQIIQGFTKGNLYEIKPLKKQGIIALGALAIFGRFLKTSPLPLVEDFPNLEGYERIFIGAPIYAGNIPPALESFLNQFDFKGKTVIPFATYNGGEGSFFEKFRQNAKNAVIVDGQAFNMKDKDIENKIKAFVDFSGKTK
ncbi:MAG: hypothetical protein LBH29_04445 [Elusimicrobiota bacterium]|nr:hypothetical protein [Elusimicrobiota bacterium]